MFNSLGKATHSWIWTPSAHSRPLFLIYSLPGEGPLIRRSLGGSSCLGASCGIVVLPCCDSPTSSSSPSLHLSSAPLIMLACESPCLCALSPPALVIQKGSLALPCPTVFVLLPLPDKEKWCLLSLTHLGIILLLTSLHPTRLPCLVSFLLSSRLRSQAHYLSSPFLKLV